MGRWVKTEMIVRRCPKDSKSKTQEQCKKCESYKGIGFGYISCYLEEIPSKREKQNETL